MLLQIEPSAADQRVFTASEDVTVDGSLPDVNLGGADQLELRQIATSTSAYVLLWFDLSAIPATANVISATLDLFVTDTWWPGEVSISAHRIVGRWTEAGVTWNTQPAIDPGGSSVVTPVPGSYISLDVTAIAQQWVSSTNRGLMLQPGPEREGFNVFFTSRESIGRRMPRLRVNYSTRVSMAMPVTPLFIGAYHKVSVEIAAGSGLQFSNVEFSIPAGPQAGLVSLSADREFDPLHPSLLLLAGYEPGTYQLEARDKATSDLLAAGEFTVTDMWDDEDLGPSFWAASDVWDEPWHAAWGGGTSQPENFDVLPSTGTRRVAILLVDTSSQRYNAAQVPAIRTEWLDEVASGVVRNGRIVSSALFYEEASYGQFHLTAEAFGPVSLPGIWTDYFNWNTTNNFWEPRPALAQQCATAGDNLIDYRNFDSIVCVFQSVTTSGPVRYAWPHGSRVARTVKVNDCNAPGHCDRNLKFITMPFDWHVQEPTRFILTTLAHEMGHNLGLPDQYADNAHPLSLQARAPGGWETMDTEDDLPHFSIAHRMMLGWLPQSSIKLYNFQTIGGYVDETIALHPLELGSPPAGRFSAIEVRIAPGWNYYFEYRIAQTTQIGDRALPTNDRVLQTDVGFVLSTQNPSNRRAILLQRTDSDGDGPVLGNGQDYREQDTTSPTFPTDFRADVSGIDGARANVRIRYGVFDKPDLCIRPWDGTYQSPDIEVRNARSQADPKWRNVPWDGHSNTIVAHIQNRGTMNAPGVKIDFYVKDMTLNNNGTARTRVGSVTRDIPALQDIDCSATWVLQTPAGQEPRHYCVSVEIQPYTTPGPNPVKEMTTDNNVAQSNYDQFISKTASPPSREISYVMVANPYDRPARVFVHVAQNNPLYRVYIENRWVLLQPHQSRAVRVMFEYVYEDVPVWIPYLEAFISKPDQVRMTATIENPTRRRGEAENELGGASFRITTGRATRIVDFAVAPPDAVHGRVETVAMMQPVSAGMILLAATYGEGGARTTEYAQVDLQPDGGFAGAMAPGWRALRAYYLPDTGYGDSFAQIVVPVTRARSWPLYE
jgi:M6 family metalloprotease-like protein